MASLCSQSGESSNLTAMNKLDVMPQFSLLLSDSEEFWKPSFTKEQLLHFKEALRKLKAKSRKSLYEEFLSLQGFELQSGQYTEKMKTALLPVNMPKNRYLNILPFDDTRVIIQGATNSNPDSTYVNASVIEDPRFAYLPRLIAAQGPMETTISDFWEMVFQQKCSAIVMLTAFSYFGQEKCATYFPVQKGESLIFGRYVITTRYLLHSHHGIVKRIIEISSEKPKVSHKVLHFHYLDWPDGAVPPSTRHIRELFRCLYNMPDNAGSILIHCSAGIGRTGTYCTIDYTLRRVLAGDMSAVEIQDTVRLLRTKRIGMVETLGQYRFCYAAVIDELQDYLSSRIK